MQVLRSAREIEMMREAGLAVWGAHQVAAKMIAPGVTTGEIDAAVEEFFVEQKALPLFKNYPNPDSNGPPFPTVTCMSVNEEVVHGIPGPRKLVDGDIVSIDTGCKVKNWCGDAAVTHAVGQIDPKRRLLLDVTSGVLDLAIQLIGDLIRDRLKDQRKGQWPRWKEIAGPMEKYVKDKGLSVVEQFVGHGIGKEMHEDPQVPNFPGQLLRGHHNFELRPGLVIAVEPMVNLGTKRVVTHTDKWTQVTADGKPSAHFEHTIAITESGPYVLTAGPDGEKIG